MKLRPISACHRLCRLLGSTCDAHQWQLGVATAGFAHSFPGAHLNVCPVCCLLKNITNIIADLAVQRMTPPLLVVHLSRVVCTWLPWKYRAQVLVNTKGWCFDVGNVGNKMIQWDDIRWTMTHAWMILMWRIHVDLNWQPSSRFLPTPGSDWQPSFIERSDRKQLFKLLRLRTCRFQSCSVF